MSAKKHNFLVKEEKQPWQLYWQLYLKVWPLLVLILTLRVHQIQCWLLDSWVGPANSYSKTFASSSNPARREVRGHRCPFSAAHSQLWPREHLRLQFNRTLCKVIKPSLIYPINIPSRSVLSRLSCNPLTFLWSLHFWLLPCSLRPPSAASGRKIHTFSR